MKNKCAGRSLLSVLLFWVAQVAWAQSPSFDISGFNVSGNTLLPEATVQQVLAPFTGAGRGMKDVNAAADALRQAYAEAGYPIVRVFPPEQTLASGKIALQVIEGKLRQVEIAGNKIYSAENIRASLPPLKEGQSPNAGDLVAAITLANENPAKQVAVNFQAGVIPGDVNARVDVTEGQPEKYILNYDNAGSKATGYDRVSVAWQNANWQNRDHMLTLQYATTVANPDEVINIVGGYRMPFYELGLSLDLIGAYSNTSSSSATAAGALQFTGRGTYVGARLNQTLPNVGELRHKISYGLDYKDFGNACTISGISLTSCGTVTAMPLSATYALQYAAPTLQAGGSIGYFSNVPGGMHGGSGHYTAARAQSTRHWDAWRYSGFVATPLPDDWQFRASLNGQVSGKALVAAEQFGLGGASSVRGYDERTTSGDYGFGTNLEVYTPDVAKLLSAEGWQIRGLVFFDTGTVRRNFLQGGERKETSLSSIGFGARASLRKELSLKLDVGWARQPWIDTASGASPPDEVSAARFIGIARANGPGRNVNQVSAHVSMSYSF
ncbi:MAG: ShlB/FhaC/HecB family hemolysin secretion/activation protein [Rhodocyclaceae bacterium]|nr:ShlB/FhaC/HecB family hemolysin secretion/activation protein [Rhodocyclaceae bacterium]